MNFGGLIHVDVPVDDHHLSDVQVSGQSSEREILWCAGVVSFDPHYGQKSVGPGRYVDLGGRVEVPDETSQQWFTGKDVA